MHFLNWEWETTGTRSQHAIRANPDEPKSRHWYSLNLYAIYEGQAGAMAQSDTIMTLDQTGDYMIGRGSLPYFTRRNPELRGLMLKTIGCDTLVAWGYDRLGMAYCEMQDRKSSISNYFKAFELSDGTVEVSGGLGHALGLAGQYEPAKHMANHYHEAAQRAFIHIGIGEHDEAIRLLQLAYDEQSRFIIFSKIEPWYDPMRDDPRLQEIIDKMEFPMYVTGLNPAHGRLCSCEKRISRQHLTSFRILDTFKHLCHRRK